MFLFGTSAHEGIALTMLGGVDEVQAILAEELPLLYGFSPYGYVGIKNKWRNVHVPKAGTTLWNIEELWTEQKGAN